MGNKPRGKRTLTAYVDVEVTDAVSAKLAPLAASLRVAIQRMCDGAAQREGLAIELSITMMSDDEIHTLNRDYREVDRPTDVLAFAQREGLGGALHPELLGDVMISLDTATRQAKRTLHDEVLMLAAHGLCHLLGYDHRDDDEEQTMNTRVASLLAEARRDGPTRAA